MIHDSTKARSDNVTVFGRASTCAIGSRRFSGWLSLYISLSSSPQSSTSTYSQSEGTVCGTHYMASSHFIHTPTERELTIPANKGAEKHHAGLMQLFLCFENYGQTEGGG